MSETASRKKKYCYNCGSQVSTDESFCPKCGKSQDKKAENKVDKTASGILTFCGVIGILLCIVGVFLLVGTILTYVNGWWVEDLEFRTVWVPAYIIYVIFVSTGLINVSLGVGITCLLIGGVLFYVGFRKEK